jgi:uncharacterized protein
VRFLWTAAGTLFLAIGIAGVILPLMPGTVFLLLASICYVRGSERLHRWLMGHPVLGRQVRIMLGEEPMPRRSKITAIAAMWIAVGISLLAAKSVVVQGVLVALALFGTWFIAARR